jgi:hypothetical protein
MLKLSLVQPDPLINPTSEIVDVTFSGNYVAGGDTLNLTASDIADPGLLGVLGPNQNPPAVEVISQNLDGAYVEVIPGAALNEWLLQCFQADGTEEPAGAYPEAFTTGSPVLLRIIFNPADR